MDTKVAVIGMGNMGCKYAQMIAAGQVKGAEVAAVTRITEERKKECREVFVREIPIYSSADELFQDVERGKLNIDAVVIATPHLAHEGQTVKAMQLGLHVLCDKPSGVYSRQARMMRQEAEKHPRLQFAMMFNQRMNPVYQKMREIVKSGVYGDVLLHHGGGSRHQSAGDFSGGCAACLRQGKAECVRTGIS